MKRVLKGNPGYIAYQRKVGIIRTAILLGAVALMFITGLIIAHTNKNYFSIMAALMCLPAGWSCVNLIMYLRARPISDEAVRKIREHQGGLHILYELYMTSDKGSYNIQAVTVLERNIAAFSEDPNIEISDAQDHIRRQIALSKYHDYTIKVFDNIDAYTRRLDELEKLRQLHGIDTKAIEDAWVPGTVQTVSGVLESISL